MTELAEPAAVSLHLRGGRDHTLLQEVLCTLQEFLPCICPTSSVDASHPCYISLGVRQGCTTKSTRASGGTPLSYSKDNIARVGGVHTRCGTNAWKELRLGPSPEVYTISPAAGCGLAPLSGVGTPLWVPPARSSPARFRVPVVPSLQRLLGVQSIRAWVNVFLLVMKFTYM
ncbi:hypothetical protein AAC387_Pa01g2593 [Persea americana]